MENKAALTRADMIDTVKIIAAWRIGKPAGIEMHAEVNDGFLYMNGAPVARICAKMPKMPYDPAAAYWENRILARQEGGY